VKIGGYELYLYNWNEAQYEVESADVDLFKFEQLFKAAYFNIVG
jgi:hypothetical protein